MDALNRSLGWDFTAIIPYTLRCVQRYGNTASRLLIHTISTESSQMNLYFLNAYVDDLQSLISFLQLRNTDSTCYLIDILLVITIVCNNDIGLKLGYIFDWFHIATREWMDESELTLLLMRLRFCFRRFGLTSLHYTLPDMKHMAFASRVLADGSILRGFTKQEFVRIGTESQIGRLLSNLLTSFRQFNKISVLVGDRLNVLSAVQEESYGLSYFLPGPPLHLRARRLREVCQSISVTYCNHDTIAFVVPAAQTSIATEVFVKVDAFKYVHLSKKHRVQSIRNRFAVTASCHGLWAVSIPTLLPHTEYNITVYTNEVVFRRLRVKTLRDPSRTSDDDVFTFVIGCPLYNCDDDANLASISGALIRGHARSVDVLLTGPLSSLEKVKRRLLYL
jgi:predicted small secreted protein